jgi:ABC-2 type transport system permease protein
LAHYLRILRVLAGKEFKLKYADSALGYVWSLVKPLSYFAVLWVVFGRFFKLGGVENYPLYLLVGIVLFTFFVDAVAVAIPSIVSRGEILRRIAFPRMIVPIAGTLTAAITFAVNSCAVAFFAVAVQLPPRVEWLWIPLLLVELYVFILGLALAFAALFVRFRDIGQVWELVAQLLLFASAVMFPVGYLPTWFQAISFANPFFQVMQDIRVALIGVNQPRETITAVYGTPYARLIPIAVALGVFAVGVAYFRREAPTLAERV